MRRITLLAIATMALMGTLAASASALTVVEVKDAGTDELCEQVVLDGTDVLGGCELSFDDYGPIEYGIQAPPFGPLTIDHCSMSFTIRVDGDGRGWTQNPDFCSNPGQSCSDQLNWPVEIVSTGGGEYALNIEDFCWYLYWGGRTEGNLSLDMDEDGPWTDAGLWWLDIDHEVVGSMYLDGEAQLQGDVAIDSYEIE